MPPVLSGYIQGKSKGGPECEGFERDLEQYYKVAHARVFNSATSALHAALVAVGVATGMEVIVPAYSMSASAAAIVHAGARPIFADIGDQYVVTRDTVKAVRTDKTAALVAVYLFGHHIKWDWLPSAFPVVHDCSQAPSARPNQHRVRGVWVYSLNQHKVLSTGEGGYALTFDDDIAEKLHLMRNHGEDVSSDIIGYNYRMTEPTASLGRKGLEDLDYRLEWRRRWADRFSNQFDYEDRGNKDWYRFPIRVKGTPVDRQRVARRVGGNLGYVTPTHKMPWFQAHGYNSVMLPNTELIEREIITVTPP